MTEDQGPWREAASAVAASLSAHDLDPRFRFATVSQEPARFP